MNTDDILRSIELAGAASAENISVRPILQANLKRILDTSSGSPRILRVNKFNLITSLPLAIKLLSPFEIRCSLCKRPITYPVWYMSEKFAVNQFHYFICFNSDSPNKPNVSCL